MKSKKYFTLSKKYADPTSIAVLITANEHRASYYPYDTVADYMEVSLEYDIKTLKPDLFRGEEHWTYRLLRTPDDGLANWQGREHAIRYTGIEAIESAEKQVRRNLAALRKAVKLAHDNPVYLTLKPVADSTIKHYSTDFTVHDALTLYTSKPSRFLWMVRTCGTWLITQKSKSAQGIISYALHSDPHEYYYYDQGKLIKIESCQAMEYYNRLPEYKEQ